MVPPERFGVAASIVLGGMMIATVAGLPLSAILDQYYGWRVSFALIIVLTSLAGIGIILIVPKFKAEVKGSIKAEFGSIINRSIWGLLLQVSLLLLLHSRHSVTSFPILKTLSVSIFHISRLFFSLTVYSR